MSTRKIILCLVVACFCGGTGGVVYGNRKLHKQRVEQAEILHLKSMLEDGFRQAKAHLSEVDRLERAAVEQLNALQKQLDDALAKQAAAAVTTGDAAKPRVISQRELMATNPEYQKLFLTSQRLGSRAYYSQLYKKLGLTPQQIETFEDLLTARLQASFDLEAAGYSQGLTPSDPAFRKLKDPALAEINAKIKELLGAEGFKEFSAYQFKTGGPEGRGALQVLASNLFYTEAPLTVDQSEKLQSIIGAHYTLNKGRQEVDWETVYAQAQGILLPTQLAALKADRESARLSRLMSDIAQKATQEQP